MSIAAGRVSACCSAAKTVSVFSPAPGLGAATLAPGVVDDGAEWPFAGGVGGGFDPHPTQANVIIASK
jgi:hypothetical protein